MCLPFMKSSLPTLITEMETGKNFTLGKSRDGRPIVYVVLSRENTWEPKGNSMALIYSLERAIASMEDSVIETICIVDCGGVGMTNAPAVAFISSLIEILGKHYPRRNGKIFICNVSQIFYFIWNIISVALSDVARAKVIILSDDMEEMRSKIGTGTVRSERIYIYTSFVWHMIYSLLTT